MRTPGDCALALLFALLFMAFGATVLPRGTDSSPKAVTTEPPGVYEPLASVLTGGSSVYMVRTKTVPPFFAFIPDVRAGGARDHSAKMLRDHGVWEPPQTAAYVKLLRRRCGSNRTVVNAGAFIGYYSLLAAKLGCRVHVWEPQPVNAALLRLGVAANQLSERVTVHQNICTEEKGSMTFSGDGMDGHVTGSYTAAAGALGKGRQKELNAPGGAHDDATTTVSYIISTAHPLIASHPFSSHPTHASHSFSSHPIDHLRCILWRSTLSSRALSRY
jgi:FkbM family methyltransferase